MVERHWDVKPYGVGLVIFLEDEQIWHLGHLLEAYFVLVDVYETECDVFFDQQRRYLLVVFVKVLSKNYRYVALLASDVQS